ncbi:TolC family protein [Pedobacter foliorum]|uniref:TolC family protein n=1 Tax=Pedobacter foliorum TaxID=2739058 RepID=UPI0015657158|nr:TolC family protein [Pedobacter foliorum]NRF38555.1 TolC family protein [Pedobacter foliorum]
MKKKIKLVILSVCLGLLSLSLHAQDMSTVMLDLSAAISLARENSLQVFRARNIFSAEYWAYRSFKANRLPSLSLSTSPANYSKDFIRRYNSDLNIDTYRRQLSYFSDAKINLQQNIDLTGGVVFVESGLNYLKNFGENDFQQYSSVPIKVGYQQDLVGYNQFKWEKRIAPLKYTQAERRFIYSVEENAEITAQYFFDLAIAQSEYELAQENLVNIDSILTIGKEKFKILSIEEADLLTLQLDFMNAQNTIKTTNMELQRAMFALATNLNRHRDTHIKVIVPEPPKSLNINEVDALRYARLNNPDIMEGKQQVLTFQQIVEKTKIESRYSIGLFSTIGYNQIGNTLSQSYSKPLQQIFASISITVPILDWGVRRGNYNVAKNNLATTRLSAEETEIKIEKEVSMTLGDFSIQTGLIKTASKALEISKKAYEQNKQRFMIGKTDISSLTLANNRMQTAQRNYMIVLRSYWQNYFKLRKLTLYDFKENKPINL